MQSISVSYSEVAEGNLPLWYAAEKGIFARNGLDVTLQYAASSAAVSALLANDTQISNGGTDVASAIAGGADLIVVAAAVPVYPYVFLVGPGINTVDDLRGKQIAVSARGSSSDVATRDGLIREGLDPDEDVIITPVGNEQNRRAALLSGAVQGAIAGPPESLDLEKAGFHALFSLAALKAPVLDNGSLVARSYATQHRDVVQAFVDALVESIAAIKQDKPGSVAVLEKYFNSTDDAAMSGTYDFAVSELFPSRPHVTPDLLQTTVEQLGAQNPSLAHLDLASIMDDSYVQSAAARGLENGS